MRHDSVLRHALAVGVHFPEIELREGGALLGGNAQPARRLGVVLRHAFAIVVQEPEAVLASVHYWDTDSR